MLHTLQWGAHRTLAGCNTAKHPAERTSKMSIEGWWMVHTTVRPVSTVARTASCGRIEGKAA